MQTLAFDGRMGASGDMLLGALIGAGADRAVLSPVEVALDIEYQIGETVRCGISATDVDVLLTTDESDVEQHGEGKHHHHHDHAGHEQTDHEHDHHSHDHRGHDNHDEPHEHADHDHTDQEHSHAEGAGPHRSYPEVIEIVESMGLPESVEADAKAVFRLLGEAEASVHGTDIEETHFHEVGANDAIADIVGVALLFDDMDAERVVTTPLSTGGGEVEISHGVYPVPTPAVVELAAVADWSTRGGPVESELLTPTGAAILAHFADGVERLPTLNVDGIGYGAGNKSFDPHPNVLRAIYGRSADGLSRDPVTVLETNVDDATPEELGGLQETLTDAGALDVSILPATMKKSRPGHLIKVIVKPEEADQVARRLALETGTLGVREHGRGHRLIADREVQTVSIETPEGSAQIPVKIARLEETVFDISAEFDDAKAVAATTGLSVREIMRRAESRAYESFETEQPR